VCEGVVGVEGSVYIYAGFVYLLLLLLLLFSFVQTGHTYPKKTKRDS
jgi:hypothetical protein